MIIECRNQDAQIKNQNGDWQTILHDDILIEEGDEILVKSSFIDTQASSSQKIQITEDTTFGFKFNYGRTLVNLYGITDFTGQSFSGSADYKDYVLTRRFPPNTASIVLNYYLKPFNPTLEMKAVEITFNYTRVDGTPGQRTQSYNATNAKTQTTPIQGKIVPNGTTITTTPSLTILQNQFNIDIDELIDPVNPLLDVFEPYEAEISINIPQGNYDPDELCEFINAKMTNIRGRRFPQTAYRPNNNPLLDSASGLQSKFRNPDNTNKYQFYYTDPDGGSVAITLNDMYNYASQNPTPTFLGINQFEIAFDQPSKSFQINYAHMPYYYQSQIATVYDVADSNTIAVGSRNNFIVLSEVFPQDFWENTLGFDIPSIVPNVTYQQTLILNSNDTIGFLPQINTEPGATTTSGDISLDTQIDKAAPLELQNYPFYASLGTDQTLSIQASKQNSLDALDKFGYYLIEVNSKFRGNFYTPENNYKAIQQIVSRYYEFNSYTSSEQPTAIYQHSGEPMLLQSFNCRILDSNKVLATNIGDDNTIHIQVVKNNITNQKEKSK